MAYFCLIDLSSSNVPHMEFLEAESPTEAEFEARALSLLHQSAKTTSILNGEGEVTAVLPPPGKPRAAKSTPILDTARHAISGATGRCVTVYRRHLPRKSVVVGGGIEPPTCGL